MMNIWVVASSYNSDLYASTHLTRKGAYLAAVGDMWDCMNISQYDTMDEFWEEAGLEEGEEKPEWFPADSESLRALSADEISDQFDAMSEMYWDTHDWGDRVELEIINTKVQA